MAAFLHTHDTFNSFFSMFYLFFFFIVDVFALFQSLNYFKLNQARITVLFAFYVCVCRKKVDTCQFILLTDLSAEKTLKFLRVK